MTPPYEYVVRQTPIYLSRGGKLPAVDIPLRKDYTVRVRNNCKKEDHYDVSLRILDLI